MAWGIFYQTVNIGGFVGPLVAARMRSDFAKISPAYGWMMVFVACALIISLNFLLLLTYREVGKEEIQFEAFSKPMDFFHKMGLFDAVDTSSSKEELFYYRQRLEYRADWLEVILEDTLKELEQLEKVIAGKTPPESGAGVSIRNGKYRKARLPAI